MIFAGPCLLNDVSEEREVINTARALKGVATHFRCKLWGGGTSPEKYFTGYGKLGLSILQEINDTILPTGTETQTTPQVFTCCHNDVQLSYIWIGARNCQNYGLINSIKEYWPKDKMVLFKRGPGMTLEETVNLYKIYCMNNDNVYIVERGVNTFDRQSDCRWTIQLNDILRLKYDYPEIFEKLIVDCSHSAGRSAFVGDIYNSCKTLGIQHFMFECMVNPDKTKTDKDQMISVDKLVNIIK